MAKKKANKTSLITNVVIIALAVLTICTLFMPVLFQKTLATDATVFTAKGTDVLAAMFAGELSLDMSAGTAELYLLRAAEDTAFVATLFSWLYLITLCVSAVSLVFAVLNIIGLQFNLVNKILGIALVVLAIATFIFAISVAAQWSEVTEVLGNEIGTKGYIHTGIYMLIGTLVAGCAQVYSAKK